MTLTVIVPCYNESSRGIGPTSFESRLETIYNQLSQLDYKLILVDDGSTDDSVEVFNDFVEDYNLYGSWCCLESETNQGKGSAVLRGILASNTDYVLLLDADLSVSPYTVVKLIYSMRGNECYVGTRYAPASGIVNPRSSLRRFISYCCRVMVETLFGFGVSDTQCGFKLLPTRKCYELTDYTKNSWIYDVEILYNLKVQGVSIREIPVQWNNMEKESTVRALDAIVPSVKALFLLFKKKRAIKFHYRR